MVGDQLTDLSHPEALAKFPETLQKGPVLGYHMWTEVWVRGDWVPIDATLGRGSIGAAHLKISDHSWHDTQSLKPLLPVMRVMLGKVSVDVVKVEGE